MTTERVRQLLAEGESTHLEFKEARNSVPASFYPTVCSFLNHEGGDILLGADDAGNAVGVDPETVSAMNTTTAAMTNDGTFLDPPFLLFPETVVLDEKTIVILQVPESSRIHRLRGHIYDRSADGDFRVTNPTDIARMASKKQGQYSETKIYPFLHLENLDQSTIAKARNLMASRHADHPWLSLDTETMLKKAGLYSHDFSKGEEGYNLAAGLLFGTEETIQSLVPHYKTDALLRRSDLDRYDDRIDIRANLINAYSLLMDFIAKHMPGLINITRYLPYYAHGAWAEYQEGEVFKTIIHLGVSTPPVTPMSRLKSSGKGR